MLSAHRVFVGLCFLVACAGPALTQTPAPAGGIDLAPIRVRVPTEPDQRQITQWFENQLRAAAADDPAALKTFRRAVLEQYQQRDATDGFRATFAQLGSRVITQFLTSPAATTGRGPVMAAVLLMTLAEMKQTSTVEAAIAGLGHAAEVVRDRASACLATLAPQLSDADLARSLAALQAAAIKETSPLVLREMYRALALANRPEEATKAVAAILQGRLNAYRSRDLRATRGDVAAAEVLAGFFGGAARSQITAPTAKLAVQRLAELLTAGVLTYVTEPAATTDDKSQAARLEGLELLIDATEKALTVAARAQREGLATPTVAEKMKQGGNSRNADMQLELNRWIGTSSSAGVLNAAPFSLPAGLPDIKIAPPANRTATQPAA